MRRDLVRYFQADIKQVYAAYLQAIYNDLKKPCTHQPFSMIQFSLNMTLVYNMNGGSCTIHFIPYSGGTAVNLRYSIAQLLGARYGAHEEFIYNAVVKYLGISGYRTQIPIDMFLNTSNQVVIQPGEEIPQLAPVMAPEYQASQAYAQSGQPQTYAETNQQSNAAPAYQYPQTDVAPTQPQANVAPAQSVNTQANAATSFSGGFCGTCGKPMLAGAIFCGNCGAKRI